MPKRNAHESGFALILSLLALVLLTTMGLALANSTGVELQISTNHRWSESAKFNAEAGIEYGRSILMTLPSWSAILPPVRPVDLAGAWDGAAETAPFATVPSGNRGTRNFENWKCDEKGYGMGYGLVIDKGDASGAEEFRSQIGGATLNGAFTLWVRRPVAWGDGPDADTELGDGTSLQDYNDPADPDTVLILVSEGTAPYVGAANLTGFSAQNRAVFTIETVLSRAGTVTMDSSGCGGRAGQAGGSAAGNNVGGCVAITGIQ
jgi:hypothetical protein